MKSESYIQRSYSQVEKRPASSSKWSTRCSLQLSGPIDAEEIRPAPLSKESILCPLAVNFDGTPRVGNNGEEADTVSAEYIERLILLTSNSRSRQDSDDEMVDLTEPRLESFCLSNIKTP
jgi:hypothetical protein